MAQFYQILKADPLGDPWTPSFEGAKPTQQYWCQVAGEDLAVSIGKQVPNTLTPGEYVYGDLVKATSQRGTNYWKFKSAKIPEGVQRPASTPAQATAQQAVSAVQQQFVQPVGDAIPAWAVPLYNMVEYIYNEMKKMDTTDLPAEPAAKGVEQLGGEPLDAATLKTLDDIFTPPEATEPEPEDK